MKRAIYYVISVLLLCVVPITSAQGDCPALVEQALAAVGQMCQSTGRNQACYGNIKIDTEPQPGADDFRFEVVGDTVNVADDTVNVADIQQMILSGMNEASSEWGVALLRLQTSIPGTLPGQNVTFLLFGDVALAPDESVTDAPPLSAFLLRTGINDAPCEEAPESGLLVQTPEGVSEVTFSINGVEVQMGSTVLFKNDSEGAMSVSTLEGLALARWKGWRWPGPEPKPSSSCRVRGQASRLGIMDGLPVILNVPGRTRGAFRRCKPCRCAPSSDRSRWRRR